MLWHDSMQISMGYPGKVPFLLTLTSFSDGLILPWETRPEGDWVPSGLLGFKFRRCLGVGGAVNKKRRQPMQP